MSSPYREQGICSHEPDIHIQTIAADNRDCQPAPFGQVNRCSREPTRMSPFRIDTTIPGGATVTTKRPKRRF